MGYSIHIRLDIYALPGKTQQLREIESELIGAEHKDLSFIAGRFGIVMPWSSEQDEAVIAPAAYLTDRRFGDLFSVPHSKFMMLKILFWTRGFEAFDFSNSLIDVSRIAPHQMFTLYAASLEPRQILIQDYFDGRAMMTEQYAPDTDFEARYEKWFTYGAEPAARHSVPSLLEQTSRGARPRRSRPVRPARWPGSN